MFHKYIFSLYLWALAQLMPLGPGLLWTLHGRYFKKQIMTDQTSFVALQWLQYLQATEFCVDSTGKRITIENLYHRGEKEFEGMKVDGYMLKNGQHIFLEFNGKTYSRNIISLK